MDLTEILQSLDLGKINVSQAKKLLSLYSVEKIEDFAKIDISRKLRRGIPEVIFAEKKELVDIKKIILTTTSKSDSVLVSRISKDHYKKILTFSRKNKLKIHAGKNTTTILFSPKLRFTGGKVGILTAGTSDIGVAEEARLVCESMGCQCICSYDIGIAGIHRLFPVIKKVICEEVDVIIVVAGMEGALASVVSSLVDIPVIGVPSSVGYGYGEKGIAALASMLQSCTLGLSVVNIDNGIGAGAFAANVANRSVRKKTRP
ncbi:MAG: nickel pincer cofactor biosynthesis protein LarB [Thaumarchaeota archaeon]|nr:nickel pincer cofactor biosynthesis protein LarB [Nitrososphaerota archaeon]MDE1831438.1 nickel pincer cofactor biosynthesis protein LarB [Nitrososphaerota archaeon]MDE1841039.1 nickel pincer cofactor biosynthesis protein LarB [Nitrososphaerota archaeon]MDE1877525.1 nickel pincer cofactor biosynthesis protein LarB [Nitrososphaerota archaeon]